jgi:hypothetical protein
MKTVFPHQGHYAHDQEIAEAYLKADVTVACAEG